MMYVRSADQPAMHMLTQRTPGRSFAGGTPEQRGRFVYSQLCETCHGADRARITFPKTIGPDRFKIVVRTGREEMPAFSTTTLSQENLDALMAYLVNPAAGAGRPGQPSAGRGYTPPPPPPPPPDGQVRYYGRLGAMLYTNSGLSAISPPWAQLVAYDLNEGTIKWHAPLGTVPGLAAKGIKDTGNNLRVHSSGPVVTAGGLIFIGTWADRTFRAYDKDTGKILWEHELEASPQGIPAVYEADGRQFVVIFAAGAATEGRESSMAFTPAKPEAQGFYVFALPKK
jgi:quinoprotein glucose dehydrogenase